jgi:nicotinamide-nucleotide amidase
MAQSDDDLFKLAVKVGRHLLDSSRRITTAESCTGGFIGKVLTDVPGSSQWFETGYVTYANPAKIALLGVPAEDLEAHGAVSESVVRAMAVGALGHAGAQVAVAVSGIAGPGGGTPGKPVGTVWFAWAWMHGRSVRTQTRMKVFKGDRDAVRRKAVANALEGVLDL